MQWGGVMARETKTCYVCKEVKDRTAFHKNRSEADGLDRRCRRCRNLNLTLKYLTGVPGQKRDLSDFPIGPYKQDTLGSVMCRILEIECEEKILESQKIALKNTALQLLDSGKINTYIHPVYGTMSIEKGNLKIQFNDVLEAADHVE
jgi:hypothetical protein